ncbi:hypothetical protein VP01_3576g2 [Puccinia sorghi]|uniref:Uncharacterized protein n=1 Tax=Puccinia sorghi TaxID=27349 RepID=A0A0L6UX67_9BASI|nr:hypothetical protein VP01_3576g2 [Puccinia sorghi]
MVLNHNDKKWRDSGMRRREEIPTSCNECLVRVTLLSQYPCWHCNPNGTPQHVLSLYILIVPSLFSSLTSLMSSVRTISAHILLAFHKKLGNFAQLLIHKKNKLAVRMRLLGNRGVMVCRRGAWRSKCHEIFFTGKTTRIFTAHVGFIVANMFGIVKMCVVRRVNKLSGVLMSVANAFAPWKCNLIVRLAGSASPGCFSCIQMFQKIYSSFEDGVLKHERPEIWSSQMPSSLMHPQKVQCYKAELRIGDFADLCTGCQLLISVSCVSCGLVSQFQGSLYPSVLLLELIKRTGNSFNDDHEAGEVSLVESHTSWLFSIHLNYSSSLEISITPATSGIACLLNLERFGRQTFSIPLELGYFSFHFIFFFNSGLPHP